MAGVREVRVATTDGKSAHVRIEYERGDAGDAYVILSDQLSFPSPLDPGAAKIQVVNQLKTLGIDLLNIEPDQIVIEWAQP
jgi:hypothetical protein